jgi:hypothetical protein
MITILVSILFSIVPPRSREDRKIVISMVFMSLITDAILIIFTFLSYLHYHQ